MGEIRGIDPNAKYVILAHYGTKRGGWNVKWRLETVYDDMYRKKLSEKGVNLISPEELRKLGLDYTNIEFRSKDDAVSAAEKHGLSIISRAKIGKIMNEIMKEWRRG